MYPKILFVIVLSFFGGNVFLLFWLTVVFVWEHSCHGFTVVARQIMDIRKKIRISVRLMHVQKEKSIGHS